MLRFKELHQSAPIKVLCKQSGGGIVEPPTYIPGQTGGKGSKKDKKVKVDPNINFSSFNWRKDYFGTISSYGGDGYQAEIKAKTIELLKYLKEQPTQLMKDQKIDGTIKFSIEEIEEALLSDNMDDIETAFTNATDELNDPTGSLANKLFIDIKVKKEKVKRVPKTAEQKKADREANKNKPKRELTERQKAVFSMKGDDKIISRYKNALGEKKWYINQIDEKLKAIKKKRKEFKTKLSWAGLPIDDKTHSEIPAKIAMKEKEIEAIKQEWRTDKKPLFEKYKAEYEKLTGTKTMDKPRYEKLLEVTETKIKKAEYKDESKHFDVSKIEAEPEAPKRKAPSPPKPEPVPEPEPEPEPPKPKKISKLKTYKALIKKYELFILELEKQIAELREELKK